MTGIMTLLHSNQFASGGLLMVVAGSAMAALRKVPQTLWNQIVNATTVTLVVTDSTRGFTWIKYWVSVNPKLHTIRRVDLFVTEEMGQTVSRFSLAPGAHWLWWRGRLVRLVLKRVEEKSGGSSYHNATDSKRTESFVIQLLGRNPQTLNKFVAECQTSYRQEVSKRASVHFWNNENSFWKERLTNFRSLDTVYLPTNLKNSVVQDMAIFKEKAAWYESLGIPYHRGYLFHGSPGTGKTALISGLASRFTSPVYFLKLNELSDAGLAMAVANVPADSFIVLEDVDCVAPKRRESLNTPQRLSVTLSGLLNVLDGLQSPVGAIYVLTTNDPGSLDSALIRPGRIDMKLDFDYDCTSCALDMGRKMLPECANVERVVAETSAKTMAEYQEAFLRLRQREGDHTISAWKVAKV
jgi:mitochondrial chaperone BCS1